MRDALAVLPVPYRQFVNPLCGADLRYQYITSASLRKGGYFYDRFNLSLLFQGKGSRLAGHLIVQRPGGTLEAEVTPGAGHHLFCKKQAF